ncbi:hypothetical protein CO666_09220 [Rhizobium chutanense]|uniref:Uncharacterized protein n=1 Tax=Rhizobium chutanense TaxID=2035448 RepID=A0A2A6JEV6_9HYPH|nr:hypothetical protein CO666_09220 [Rhizobium chutanense]
MLDGGLALGALLGLNGVAQQALAAGEDKPKQKISLKRATCRFDTISYSCFIFTKVFDPKQT